MAEHERFITGMSESRREYLVHTRTPRFVAEVFAEEDLDVFGGIMFPIEATEEVVANIVWIDDPQGHDLDEMAQAIADFFDEVDFRSEQEIEDKRRRGDL